MKRQRVSAPRRLFVILGLIGLLSCSTVEEVPYAAGSPSAVPELPPAPEREPAEIDWPGTAWIVTEPPGADSGEFPGYRGFHLGRDGRLRLINLDGAEGIAWKAESGRLSLSASGNTPGIPLNGVFLVFAEREDGGSAEPGDAGIGRIRLVPETDRSSTGVVFERAVVKVDVVENHWIPMRLRGGESLMWPMNREIHLMVLPDASGMGVLGFGGENRFRGPVVLSGEGFAVGAIAMTRRTGPASAFEDLYVRLIGESDSYVQAGDDLFLYAGSLPTVAFRVRLFD